MFTYCFESVFRKLRNLTDGVTRHLTYQQRNFSADRNPPKTTIYRTGGEETWGNLRTVCEEFNGSILAAVRVQSEQRIEAYIFENWESKNEEI